MVRKRRQWSADETKELYKALDECAIEGNNSFAQSVTKIERHLLKILKSGNSHLSEKQVKAKLHGLAKKAGVSAEKLVSEWLEHRKPFLNEKHRRQSTSASRGTSSLRGSVPPQDSEQPSAGPSSPAADNPTSPSQQPSADPSSPAADNPTLPSEQPPAEPSSLAADNFFYPSGASESSDYPANASQESGSPSPKPYDEVTKILYSAKIRNYDSFDDALDIAWAISRYGSRYGFELSNVDAFHCFSRITLDIQHGIEAFCKGFPIAHLTTSNFTPASLRLGRTLCMPWDRNRVEDTLNTLLADPLVSNQALLRAFAGAAIFEWVFVDDDCPFNSSRSTALPKPLNGSVRDFCEKYLPHFFESMKKEERLTYLEHVVQPMIPGLARQFPKDLFSVLSSLVAPPAPPCNLIQWKEPTAEAQAASEGGLSDYRLEHQMDFRRHLEEAFLYALKFNLKMRKTDPEYEFQMEYPKIGEGFNNESMTPADEMSDGRKLTQENKVTLSLCPTVWRTYGPPHNRRRHCLHKALVMVEGLGLSDLHEGYPRIVDLP